MVAMIAMKTVYYGRREYRPGQEFDVGIDREVDRLVRANKAKLAPAKPAMIDLPVMKAEEAPGEPKRRGRPPKYLRRDMTAMDGQIGEGIPLPSLPADPQPSAETLDSSEEEPAS